MVLHGVTSVIGKQILESGIRGTRKQGIEIFGFDFIQFGVQIIIFLGVAYLLEIYIKARLFFNDPSNQRRTIAGLFGIGGIIFNLIAENLIEKSYSLKRPFLNHESYYIKELFSKVINIDDRNISNKDIEINDRVLRQIMFLFNLELWYQLFIENENILNPTLSISKFL